jgi:hypothetical protein
MKLYFLVYIFAFKFNLCRYIEESGWKLVHGDVFRPPRHLPVLAALIGTGVQMCMLILGGGCTSGMQRTRPLESAARFQPSSL